jgi:hypothetical protein
MSVINFILKCVKYVIIFALFIALVVLVNGGIFGLIDSILKVVLLIIAFAVIGGIGWLYEKYTDRK